jgi:hypothetical protein
MSTLGIFVLGVVVTAIVSLALLPLLWAAVLDGRYDREQRLRLAVLPGETPPDTRAA